MEMKRKPTRDLLLWLYILLEVWLDESKPLFYTAFDISTALFDIS
jgi:hypothetical protein